MPNSDRDSTGKFKSGFSGNPRGSPLASRILSQWVRELTGDGQALVDFLLSVVRDPGERTSDRMQAATILLDRGYGRAVQQTEIDAQLTARPLEQYSVAQLETMVPAMDTEPAALPASDDEKPV